MHDMQPDNLGQSAQGVDREGAMARADLYKLANYSLKLFKKMGDDDQLEGWVQAKITKAADYIASVYHYLEYEMKVNEYGESLNNAEMTNESKEILKSKLTEAKAKLSELKKLQADKITGKQIDESHKCACEMCGGTGVVEKQIPEELKAKVRAYNKKAKAMSAAINRVDRNKNGIPDALEQDEEVTDEDQSDLKKTGDSYKTAAGGTVTKTATGVKHERPSSSYDDGGDELDTMAKSGKGTKSHAKAKSASEKKAEAPKLKKSKTGTWGMENGEKFDNRKKEKEVDETVGQGVYGEGKELKGKQKNLDVDHDGDIEADDLADLRAGKKEKKVEEGKPSAGMTKKEKSSTVKAAKAGKDIGKPGKNFDKVAKAAGGGEKGEKIAAAAMWKNKAKALKESLEAMTEAGVTDQSIEQLIELAAKADPQGLATAKQQGPEAVMEFLTRFASGQQNQATPAQEPTPNPEQTPTTAPLAESADFERLLAFKKRLVG